MQPTLVVTADSMAIRDLGLGSETVNSLSMGVELDAGSARALVRSLLVEAVRVSQLQAAAARDRRGQLGQSHVERQLQYFDAVRKTWLADHWTSQERAEVPRQVAFSSGLQ